LFSFSSLSIFVGVGDERAVLLVCVEAFKVLWMRGGKGRREQMRGRFRLLVGLAQPPVKSEQNLPSVQRNTTSLVPNVFRKKPF
tara:strand:- start:745 stop:996 length:252 start_codon:yes stop_codon:yes gene_type:complete